MALQDEGPDIVMTPGGLSGESSSPTQSPGYRNIMQSVNNGMRPDFTGQAMTPNGETPEQRRSKIQMNLRDAEGSAAGQGSTFGLDAQTGENEVSSGFTNNVGKGGSVKGKEDEAGQPSNKIPDRGGFFKKKGPLLTIILSLVFGGSGMYLSQAALPFTMLDKLNGLFDTTNTSTEMRSSSFTRNMMKNARNATGTAVTKKNAFGTEKFKPTKKMKKKLAKQGISFEGSGKMVYKNKSGATEVLDVASFKTKLQTDNDFRAAYTNGTKNWRTSVAEFNDKMFDKLLKKFGLSRNRFNGYDAEDDPDGEKARKTMADDANNATSGEAKTKSTRMDSDEETTTTKTKDANGNETESSTKKKKVNVETSESSENFKATKDPHEVSGKLSKVTAVAGTLSTVGCGITKALSALSVILAAMQVLQVLTVAQEIFEAIDKARTEDANSSPINAVGKSLTTKTSESRVAVKSTSSNGSEVDAEYEEKSEVARSAVQSEGFSNLFTGANINGADESVAGFNPTNAANKAIADMGSEFASGLGGIAGSVSTILHFFSDVLPFDTGDLTRVARRSYVHCIQIEAALAMLDTIIDAVCVVEAVLGIFTFGTTTAAAVAEEAAWQAIQAAIMAMIGLAISAVIAYVTPIVINMFGRKLVTEFAGEDLGNAAYMGGSALLSNNHRAGGGVVANKKGWLVSLIQNQNVELETARNERLARSPFDYTSSYTFAGQLASAIIPVTLQSDSILDSFGNFGTAVRHSLGSILPGASAASAADKANYAEAYTAEYCEDLAGIGAVGDAFCNPYITTDFETMEIVDDEEIDSSSNPNTAYNIMKKVNDIDSDNFKESDIDEVENPSIDLDSDLGKFVVYCGQRTSPFGQPDQNIANELESGHTGSTVGDVGVGMIPVVGGIMGLIQSKSVLENYGWIDGSNCVMDHDSSASFAKLGVEKVDYEDIKYYSRYSEDQRLASAMGIVDQSAVEVALEEYYELHPLDNSPEGVLARMSGMTKENVIATLDAVEFYGWLAQYDPTDMYPTPAIHKEAPDYNLNDDRFIDDDGLLAVLRSGFSGFYRQRNFATA
jgi:hypothetical protein